MAMMSADGIRLHYYRRGDFGRPHLVLVHGLAANTAFWFPQLLPALTRDFQVTAYDLRGHGRSDMPPSGYTTVEMAGDLHTLLEYEQAERVHLIGHSYGGAVALHYSVLHPERVISLTIADTRVGAFQPIQQLADWLGAGGTPVAADRIRADSPRHSSPFGQSPLSARTAARWALLLRTTSASQELLHSAGPDLASLMEIEAPALAIFGEYSDLLPSCHGLRRHLPDCRAVVVPGVGHFHPRTRPDYFIPEVREFLSQLVEPTGCRS